MLWIYVACVFVLSCLIGCSTPPTSKPKAVAVIATSEMMEPSIPPNTPENLRVGASCLAIVDAQADGSLYVWRTLKCRNQASAGLSEVMKTGAGFVLIWSARSSKIPVDSKNTCMDSPTNCTPIIRIDYSGERQ